MLEIKTKKKQKKQKNSLGIDPEKIILPSARKCGDISHL